MVEGETPLEAQRSHGREPTEAKPPRCAYVEQALSAEARADFWVEVSATGRLAIVRLEVPGVAEIGEDHALEAHGFEDRELVLQVLVVHEVAADVGPVRDGRTVRVRLLGERHARAQRAEIEATHVE